uniref:Uncharacterized protein n=1 Tax=Lepeophtheirus salmonis TaxID=72036 RepID=A0A0K2TAE4_LEPSM
MLIQKIISDIAGGPSGLSGTSGWARRIKKKSKSKAEIFLKRD